MAAINTNLATDVFKTEKQRENEFTSVESFYKYTKRPTCELEVIDIPGACEHLLLIVRYCCRSFKQL